MIDFLNPVQNMRRISRNLKTNYLKKYNQVAFLDFNVAGNKGLLITCIFSCNPLSNLS